MKRAATLLFLIVLIFDGRVLLANSQICCNNKSLSFSIFGDYLYWKASKPDGTALSAEETVPDLDVIENIFLNSPYSSGYRVGGTLLYNCIDFGIRYSSLLNHSNSELTSVQEEDVAFQTLNYRLRYQVIDLAIGYRLSFPCYRVTLKPYAGAKLGKIKEHTDRSLQIEDLLIANFLDTTIKGYGPMFGFEGSWQIFPFFYLMARGDVSILNSTYCPKIGGFIVPFIFDNKLDFFVMVHDIYVGLGWNSCPISCFRANVEVGYESQIWTHLRRDNASPSDSLGQLGLGGLVIHFNVIY